MRFSFPRLNEKQLEKLSDISSDVGLIALAVVAIPAVLDKFDLFRVVLGLIGTILFWVFSLWLKR